MNISLCNLDHITIIYKVKSYGLPTISQTIRPITSLTSQSIIYSTNSRTTLTTTCLTTQLTI